jgi:uncharacterized protein (DUF924 family)
MFMLTGLMHSEDIAHSRLCVELSKSDDHELIQQVHKYAVDHNQVIEQFNRYPHRNDLLERPSTSEETQFLSGDLPGWMKSVKKQ